MKKFLLLFVAWQLLLHAGYGQNRVVDSMIHWVQTHKTVDSQYILTLHRISYLGVENNLKRSFAYYEKVSYYSDSLNFTYGKGLAQINLGILFSNSSNFEASNRAYFKAIEYAEACGARRLEAVSYNNVGDNFEILKDYAKCRQYTLEAVALNRSLKAWRGLAINYELLHRCDLEDKLYDSARKNLVLGMASAELAHDSALFPLFYLGFGKLHAINNNNDSAEYYFNKTIRDAQHGNDPANEYAGYLAKAQYLKHLSADQKLGFLTKAMAIARSTANLERIADAAHEMVVVYDEKKDKDLSLLWFRVYRKAADSLFSEKNIRNVAIKETEWMVKRKEIENLHLKEFTRLQNKELAVKNGLLMAVLLVLLLSIIIAIVVYRSVQNNKRIGESQLRQSIAETQMQALRSQMNPHFIFNSLNSIDAYILSNDKYNATLYLNKFAKLIRNVLDSSKQDVIAFSKDIETLRLYIELEQQRSDNKFIADLSIDEELISSDYKVPPLIIQPFVENAILHGLRYRDDNRGILRIHISKTEEQIVYVITDNGIGRRAAAQLGSSKGKSYGVDISYERVKLFNKEAIPSVEITDLYENNHAAGTKVQLNLNIV